MKAKPDSEETYKFYDSYGIYLGSSMVLADWQVQFPFATYYIYKNKYYPL